MLKKLLSGVLFSKPAENQNLQAAGDCTDLSPYSAVSCDSSRDSPDAATFQGYLIPRKPCPSELPLLLFVFPPACEITNNISVQSLLVFVAAIEPCPSEYEPVFTPSYPTTPMRTFCYYPGSSYPPQLPRRRPGRPRVKSLPEDEERSSRDKKVKNQHLWEFIYETLLNPLYNPQYLRWENQREGVFRFVQSEAVAQLWGSRKNNENMTYEKLSRAMRHYYKRGILERVEGRRLVYKFSRKAMDRVREKRHNSV
ncbi:hypothetical protein C0Q70_04638 [Pomacea canaliculata]|uniref:ETS domain-containing protein n=2 Tax=Pomacea canaliculata TaxID=400727 RepID=A0A2T7PIX3_POMCA|nr:hypothetical protein C0Q70_04638 [Pomacea canaliculata]